MTKLLSENSELANELLVNSPDAMMALSPKGIVVYWNKGAENTFGYNRDEAVGRRLSELIIAKRHALQTGAPAVMIEFSDSGAGVKPEDLPKLWEPFFTTKPESRGTGLGLPICRRTVEKHRGTIDIESLPGKTQRCGLFCQRWKRPSKVE